MKQNLIKAAWIFLGLTISGVVVAVLLLIYFSFGLPQISTLADYRPPLASKILARDGTVLAEIGLEDREVVAIEDIPPNVINAFLSAEDDNFYQHSGIDYMGMFRALIKNIRGGKVAQGGSTITQQVAKSLLLTRERSIERKIKDILLAQRIEKKFTKEEILFLYMNQVYLGGGYYGVKSAFRGYFGKELSEATIAESAMVAGLLVAPTKYSPYVNPSYAKERQSYVLNRMLSTGKISQSEYELALTEKTQYRIRKPQPFKAGYFTDWVRQRVIDVVGEDQFKTGGFKVLTTLDWELQQLAERESYLGAQAIDKKLGYKAPIGHLENDEKIREFLINYRETQYAERSQYFIITDEYQKLLEIPLTDEEKQKFLSPERLAQTDSGLTARKIHLGNLADDPFLEFLEESKTYQAVVENVDDNGKMIYVNIGGIIGIIPNENFNWAHERIITDKRVDIPPVNRASSIVKRGDLVLVKVLNKTTGVWGYLNKSVTTTLEKDKELELLKKERYVLCTLDQTPDIQAALFSIVPKTGEVISMVGGVDFEKSQFNRALQSLRQPGSSFKPILYAAGLENGFTPSTIIMDSPEALGSGTDNLNWKPRNYDGQFKGPVTFRAALEQSRNVPTVKIVEEITVPKIFSFVDRLTLNVKMDNDLSLSLGSFGVTLTELVSAYSIFPNGGRVTDIKSIISIVDRDGTNYVVPEDEKLRKIKEREMPKDTAVTDGQEDDSDNNAKGPEEKNGAVSTLTDASAIPTPSSSLSERPNPFTQNLRGDQVYDPRLSYLMTNLLRGVILHGTGHNAKDVGQFIGGKTGTTNNFVDAWFIGFTSNIATGVWTGLDNNNPMGWGQTGAMASLPVWSVYMKAAIAKLGEYDYKIPDGIVHVRIDKKTGKLSKGDEAASFTEAFVEGTEPKSEDVLSVLEDLPKTDQETTPLLLPEKENQST